MIILFDLDGTLIDSTDAILECFEHSFAVYDYPKQEDEAIKALIGYPLDVMYANLGVKKERIWEFVATYKECYRKISTKKTSLLKSAREAIVLAHEFASLGIVTTKTGKYSQVLMEYFEIMHYFKVLIGREHVINPKPNAEPILKALEHFKKDKEEIWMIGDTKMDLISAKAAGIKAIGVLSGYDNKDTLKAYTDFIFDDVYEAVIWLKSRK